MGRTPGRTLLALAGMLVGLPATPFLWSQAANPAYLSQFPSVERIKAEIKGADPMETAARQMGAFWQFQQIIKDLSGLRWARDAFTPDEKRVLNQYSRAFLPYSQIQYPPSSPDRPKWYKLQTFYEEDDGFRDELFQRFLSPALRDHYAQVKGETRATVQARRQARQQAVKAEQAGGGGQQADLAGQQALAKLAQGLSDVFTTLATSQPGAPTAASAEAYYAQGQKNYNAKDYPKAVEAYKKAIALKPSWAQAQYALGLTYVAMEKRDQAAEVAGALEPLDEKLSQDLTKQSIAIDPVFHKVMGEKALEKGDFTKSVGEFREALRLKPDYAEASEGLGKAYFHLRQFPNALTALEVAVRLKPDSAEAHFGLGMTYVAMGKKDDAQRVYATLQGMDKESAQRLYNAINRMSVGPQPARPGISLSRSRPGPPQ